MAEAMALIGLTSSIITFITFSASLLSIAKSAHDAQGGVLPELRELDLVIRDVTESQQKFTDAVVSPKGGSSSSSSSDLMKCDGVTRDMAKECGKLAEELRGIVSELTMKKDPRFPLLESTIVALKRMSMSAQLKDVRTRLIALDGRVRQNLVEALQNDRHSKLLHGLEAINHSHIDIGIKYDIKLDEIKQSILEAADQSRRDNAARLTSIGTKLDSLEKELKKCHQQASIIQSLYFPEIKRRWSRIPDAESMTNAWLFDPSQTSFSSWLESEGGIYCISGLPGSGKSTLMKQAFDHADSVRALKKWAGPADLCMASYYFWNQGFEMQKSQIGLLQSLLYQILKSLPTLIPEIVSQQLNHESWDLVDLKTAFDLVVSQSSLTTRFCFFIDGLDEYDGEEEDIATFLRSISKSPNIKICASSRPRSIFDEMLWSTKFMLQVQDFTKPDMESYVRKRFRENRLFWQLEEVPETEARALMNQIANQANGVWLWVYLVTRDLIHASNRHESFAKLQEILNGFPEDLEAYFTLIISRVKPSFRDEMARIFLITLQEVQPLPLFAFSLLEKEAFDLGYATKAEITPVNQTECAEIDKIWEVRLQNRCSDLLVVDHGDHPVFLSRPVDFLHRTVRDFLRDCYFKQLRAELAHDFNAPLSLCRMMLYLLKKQPRGFHTPAAKNRLVSLVDEFLYYAREAEKLGADAMMKGDAAAQLAEMLDELDRVGTTCARDSVRGHWTHIRDPPQARGLDEYREGGNCNWLALAVQARLVGYVSSKLDEDPRRMNKAGRPLLDYALRPRRVMPLKMPHHSHRDEGNIDLDMVRVLLEKGADPNQAVHLNDSRSVWVLFLVSCYESVARGEATDTSKRAWATAYELLLDNGARRNKSAFTMSSTAERLPPLRDMLTFIFGAEVGARLLAKRDELERQDAQRPRETWVGWVGSWVKTS